MGWKCWNRWPEQPLACFYVTLPFKQHQWHHWTRNCVACKKLPITTATIESLLSLQACALSFRFRGSACKRCKDSIEKFYNWKAHAQKPWQSAGDFPSWVLRCQRGSAREGSKHLKARFVGQPTCWVPFFSAMFPTKVKPWACCGETQNDLQLDPNLHCWELVCDSWEWFRFFLVEYNTLTIHWPFLFVQVPLLPVYHCPPECPWLFERAFLYTGAAMKTGFAFVKLDPIFFSEVSRPATGQYPWPTLIRMGHDGPANGSK